MRKTSQDGGDSTSITSGIENELKKTTSGLAKIKRSSIKKKVQSFSQETDDGVIEPLLQKEKNKTEFLSQSAKFSLPKTKTDVANDRMDDKDKLLPDDKVEKLTLARFSSASENIANGNKEGNKSYSSAKSSIHNHMNTNIFNHSDTIPNSIVPKSKILVEIEGSKQVGYNSSPLIFTTAKIHTNGKPIQMEPVQVTPVPILSTIEGSVVKTDVRKASEENENVDVNFKMLTGLISGTKPETSFTRSAETTGFTKVLSEDLKASNNAFNTKLPIPFTSAVTINDSNVVTTKILKVLSPTVSMQAEEKKPDIMSPTARDVPKMQFSDTKSTVDIQQVIDVNKNFSLPICSTLPTINSVIEKDVTIKEKNNSINTKPIQRKATEQKYGNEKKPSALKTHSVKTCSDTKERTSKLPGVADAGSSGKPVFTMAQDAISKPDAVTVSVSKTYPSASKFITTVSVAMLTNTFVSTVPSTIVPTVTSTKKPNVKTTTLTDKPGGKITTTSVSSPSFTNTTGAVTPILPTSKNSVDPKPKKSKIEKMNNTGTTKAAAPKSVISGLNVKVESETVLTEKSTTKSTPPQAITISETFNGKTLSSKGTPIITSTTTATKNSSVKSNNAIQHKLYTSKDQVTATSSKVHTPSSCAATAGTSKPKPPISMVIKTQQNITSPQKPITSTLLTDSSVKTISENIKPPSSVMSHSHASNIVVNIDSAIVSTKASIRSTPSTTVVSTVIGTTTNQNPSKVTKSREFHNHKKEKLK